MSRFAFVLTNLAGGGAEKAIVKLASHLQRRGHDARLVLLEPHIEHALPEALKWSSVVGDGASASKGWFGRRLLARRLAAHLQAVSGEAPFDLVVSTLPFADEVTIGARTPRHWCRIANTLSADAARMSTPDRRRKRLAKYRALYRGRRLIAVSGGVATDLQAKIAPDARVVTIPNAFDLAAIRAAARDPIAPPARPYLLHVGRFHGQKRHDLLLAAFAQARTDLDLLLMTAPDARLQALIDASGVAGRVRVIGFQRNPYPWMAHARLLVLSSDHEGLPNVIVEALACGTPVVSTDCPSGPREILGAALPECLVPCGDAPALARAIERALAVRPDPGAVDLSAYGPDGVCARYEALAAERK